MANKLYEESSVQAIATAIREKNGSSDTYTVAQMGPAIRALETGGGFYPSIRVSADSGLTVTATKGGETVTLTEIESGVYWGEVTDYGTWTTSAGDAVKVEAVEQYTIKPLNDYTWGEISAISQAGTGADYFSIGDAKEISLNGTVGTLSLSNVKLCVFIIDFNHKENGVAENNIIWQGFKTAVTGGVDVALRDWTAAQGYGSYKTDGTKLFNMNHWGNYNYGGWISCDLRYDILGAVETAPSGYGSARTTSATGSNATQKAITNPVANTLMAALPSDFRSVLRLRTHYVDNKGNISGENANVTAVTDAISLLAEFEIFGHRTYANSYEQNHQAVMTYYANGNSRVKYAHDATTQPVILWECSAYRDTETHFCDVNTGGGASNNGTGDSNALAPAFKT